MNQNNSAQGTKPERYEYSFGPLVNAEGQTRFRVWAPGVENMGIRVRDHGSFPMEPLDDGFFEALVPCGLGARYQFELPDGQKVPDPASRRQDGDVHDASVVCDPAIYPWRHTAWNGRPWQETVIYEIHCGLAGGFSGVTARLPQLAGLGVTALELMPIADFPGPRNWGYDGVLPYAPDSAYGTPEELCLLIDTAHGLGMQVFLDVVYNHFGPEGNYLGAYAPAFFRDDIPTPWGAAIDFRRPPVRHFFAENALYWLREYRFDGLRFDAVHAITDKGWLREMSEFLRANLPAERHVHLILENDDNAASLLESHYDAQWNDDAHHVVHHLLTGEDQSYYASYRDDPTDKLAAVLAEGFVYQGQPDPGRKDKRRGESSKGLPPHSFVFFIQNHDQIGNRAFGERLTTLCAKNPHALKAAIALQLLTPHIPLIFMGEEYGWTGPFQYFTSYDDPQLANAVREGRRKEFAAFPEFADPEQRDLIPDPNAESTWAQSQVPANASDQNGAQWYSWYASVLRLRQRHVVPGIVGARSEGAKVLASGAVAAMWRLGDGTGLLICTNLSNDTHLLKEDTIPARSRRFFCSRSDAVHLLDRGELPGGCTAAYLLSPQG